ncbi:MAG: alpha-L-fucosidase [Gemmatimonas sp. SG8_28]|nr:MAG: alpha-L-fucosidase [Gemmatimonas sp. SG8_28]
MTSSSKLPWRWIGSIAVVITCATPLTAQPDYEPPPENVAAREWFQDAKFGLFVHWGIYSLLQNGEWIMNNRGITVSEYETLAPQFNPVAFDPAEWVALVKDAGMRYITITSKHHDGFAMFDSKVSDWDIVDRTPYGRDVLAMLADECRRQGIKLFFYHSQLDWHHPDYYPRGRTGERAGRPDEGDWYRYLDYMDAQLRELLTSYGPIGGIWFDGMWDRYDADWRLERTYTMIHELQPAALIGSNHHRLPYPGEDFQMFEKDLPGENTIGFNTTEIGALPLETAETMNGSWGYNLTDRSFKSVDELVRYLVNAAGRNANFLLNVGPMPTGEIQPEFRERLRGVGRWLAEHGEAIYGTRGGPIPPRPWGVTTQKGNRVFVHVLDWQDRSLSLPSLPHTVRAATLLRDGSRVSFRAERDGLTLTLPDRPTGTIDLIVVLELEP